MEDWEKEAISEIEEESAQSYIVGRTCKLVSFVSRSNGRGRRPRQPRDVSFLKIGKMTYQIIAGEVHNPKHRRNTPIDSAACEVLTDLPWEDRTPEALLERTRMGRILRRKARG